MPRAVFQRALALATRPATIYFLAYGLARAGGFLLIPLYTRRLSRTDYGDYFFAQMLVGALPIFLSLGIVASVKRFYFSGDDVRAASARAGGAARVLAWVTIGLTALAQVLVAVSWPRGGYGALGRYEMSCVLWASASSSIAGVAPTYLRAAQRPIAASAFQLVQFATNTGAGLVFVLVLDRGLRGAIEASLVGSALQAIASLVFIIFALEGRATRTIAREALTFALPFIPHYAASQMQAVADRFVFKMNHLEDSLGAYALASQLTVPTSLASDAWNEAASAQMGELTRRDGVAGLRPAMRRIRINYALAVAVPAVVVVVCLPLAAILVGDRFRAALWFVPSLVAIELISSQFSPSVNVVFYANRPAVVPRVTVATGVLNVVLNVVLIPRMGVAGAVTARALASVARSGAMWFVAERFLAEAPARTPPGAAEAPRREGP